ASASGRIHPRARLRPVPPQCPVQRLPRAPGGHGIRPSALHLVRGARGGMALPALSARDRKSTRLNSSHVSNSYAVFCLKKKILMNKGEPSVVVISGGIGMPVLLRGLKNLPVHLTAFVTGADAGERTERLSQEVVMRAQG